MWALALSGLTLVQFIYTDLSADTQTHSVCFLKTNHLLLCREVVCVDCENLMKQIPCEKMLFLMLQCFMCI